jgi:uncharacterized membrane protein YhiD involved in acid resistance
MVHLDRKRRKELLTIGVVFLGVLLASAFIVYLLAGGISRRDSETPQTVAQANRPTGVADSAPQQNQNDGLLSQLFAPASGATVPGDNWVEVMGRIGVRLLLAALLGAALAYRPRRRVLTLKKNPYVIQTQILLAVVASALMIVVGDNAARAFGIFAAVSLVRFRTNIRDPKEITVLLISLAIGLATGVGRWDLALVLALFSFLLLWVLELREPDQVYRSMDLAIATRNVAATHEVLRELFDRNGFDSELRELTRQEKTDAPGNIAYSVDLRPTITTDEVSEEILARDAENVDRIEWQQKKSFSYLYQ